MPSVIFWFVSTATSLALCVCVTYWWTEPRIHYRNNRLTITKRSEKVFRAKETMTRLHSSKEIWLKMWHKLSVCWEKQPANHASCRVHTVAMSMCRSPQTTEGTPVVWQSLAPDGRRGRRWGGSLHWSSSRKPRWGRRSNMRWETVEIPQSVCNRLYSIQFSSVRDSLMLPHIMIRGFSEPFSPYWLGYISKVCTDLDLGSTTQPLLYPHCTWKKCVVRIKELHG